MAIKIVKKETNNGQGKQTVIFDEMLKQYFVVSSVNHAFANETYIFQCDKDGSITNWTEVWGTRPSKHEMVMNMLLSGEITSLDFDIE